jgi:DNA-binding PucR family transcriptional regulator
VLAYDAARGTELVATLEAWFATGGRLKETGARLHVHPNTVSQRLARVGELLGADWRDPDRSLDVQLALRVHRLTLR